MPRHPTPVLSLFVLILRITNAKIRLSFANKVTISMNSIISFFWQIQTDLGLRVWSRFCFVAPLSSDRRGFRHYRSLLFLFHTWRFSSISHHEGTRFSWFRILDISRIALTLNLKLKILIFEIIVNITIISNIKILTVLRIRPQVAHLHYVMIRIYITWVDLRWWIITTE